MNLKLGMVVRNIGGTMKYTGSDIDRRLEEELALQEENNPRTERLTPKFRLPQVFQMGVAVDVVDSEMNRLTLITDVDVPSDNNERLILGSEYSFRNMAFLRTAFKMNYDHSSFAFGGGLNWAKMGIDYSFTDHEVFSSIHRFSVRFGL
jgi:hypothetical protein